MAVVAAEPDLVGCPKHMEYGPCGGVRADHACEVGDFRCVFLDMPTVRWAGLDRATESGELASPVPSPAHPTSEAVRMRALLASRPVVVADLSARPLSREAMASVGRVLSGRLDAVLAGDSPRDRVQYPPAYRAMLLRQAGLVPWTGLNCRDRNRVALEGELAALADVPTGAVHSVTGDHPRSGGRADAAPVFDLDGVELAALAVAAGHLVSVAEAPAVPPEDRRPARLVEKFATGAEVCFVNHCGGAGPAARFAEQTRALGAVARFVACVPVVLDHSSARLLTSFPSLVLPDGFLEAILSAPDPRRAGIDAAVRMSVEMVEAGLDGVDLSGGSTDGEDVAYAEALAEIVERVGVR